MNKIKEKRIQETGTPALLHFKPAERPTGCRITSVINRINQGAGRTCIFFHNWNLSQNLLEGKHPSSTYCTKFDLFINFVDFKAQKKMIRGTSHSNVVCAYSEPSRCFLTVSTAPFTSCNMLGSYKNLSVKRGYEA